MEEWQNILHNKLLPELYRVVIDLGGTISGEHGIGHKRREYMPMAIEPAQIEVMRAIKKALEPNCILNPGKII